VQRLMILDSRARSDATPDTLILNRRTGVAAWSLSVLPGFSLLDQSGFTPTRQLVLVFFDARLETTAARLNAGAQRLNIGLAGAANIGFGRERRSNKSQAD
jgi:hypothetical protein